MLFGGTFVLQHLHACYVINVKWQNANEESVVLTLLIAVADNIIRLLSETSVGLKKSKAGDLRELTKIFCRLDMSI